MEIHKNGFEIEYDFWPVEHPVEPMEEDRPVKCPMPDSSVINGDKVREPRAYESLRKRTELSKFMRKVGMSMESGEPPVEAMRKRHHTLAHGDNFIPPAPHRRSTNSFTMFNDHFKMFQH